jgi:IS5 family transposase
VIVNSSTKQIICTAHGKVRQHDFQLFKTSLVKLKPEIECLADKGYQGLQKLHRLSQTPKKKPRKAQLSTKDKQLNRQLAKLRVVGEHVNRCLKVFKILSERYRNRRKRFGLRFNLIAGLYNFELGLTI